jgi:hypothetical protein
LTKEHEKLKCSHDDLVQRYEVISIEQIKAVNHSSYIAQLENKNAILKNTIEKLNIENLALQEKHDIQIETYHHVLTNVALKKVNLSLS